MTLHDILKGLGPGTNLKINVLRENTVFVGPSEQCFEFEKKYKRYIVVNYHNRYVDPSKKFGNVIQMDIRSM